LSNRRVGHGTPHRGVLGSLMSMDRPAGSSERKMMKRCVREAGQSLAPPCRAQGRTLGTQTQQHPRRQTYALLWDRRPKQIASPSFEIPGDLVVGRNIFWGASQLGRLSFCWLLILRGRDETQEGQRGQVGELVCPGGGARDERQNTWPAGSSSDFRRGWAYCQRVTRRLVLWPASTPRTLTAHEFEFAFSNPDVDGPVPSNLNFDTTLQLVSGSLPLIGAGLGRL